MGDVNPRSIGAIGPEKAAEEIASLHTLKTPPKLPCGL